MSSEALWFQGPTFLYKDETEWPGKSFNIQTPTIEELRIHTTIVNIENLKPHIIVTINKYSNWNKLIRVNAYVQRAIDNWTACIRKTERISGALLCNEIKRSEVEIIRKAQWDDYKNEIMNLFTSLRGNVTSNSKLHQLSPYLDEDKVLRIRGRIDALPNVTEYQKRPIILGKKNSITHLLVEHYHQKYLHKNHETVINEVRQKFFIPRLRELLKTIRSTCQKCKNEAAKPNPPEMAGLPPSRLETFTRPFTFVGVDFFGPMTVAIGRRQEKRYGALFTCMTTRAVHVEVAHSLSTDSFIMVFRNFISIRGTPREVQCDNGTNFHGSKNELSKALSEISDEKIKDKFMDIKWRFNPPSAPHMGGAWERLIRSVKANLLCVLPTRTPSDELLRTCLMEVANIVNSRPLTYIPIDPESPEAITPNHFLLGSSSGVKPAGKFDDRVMLLRKQWKISQQVADHFWKRWVREYAPIITRRTKWYEKVDPIKTGSVVLIADENNPRNSWPMGIVEEVIVAKDGQVRQARVKVGGVTYTRPVTKIAVLDLIKNEKDV